MDHCTAGQWRFHVLGEHMRDRILHCVTEFYRPRAANRPLRSLVVATRGKLSDICRTVKRQRQTQRFQHSVAIVEDHVPARENLLQPAQRLSVSL